MDGSTGGRMMSGIESRVLEYMREQHMTDGESRVLAAVSGGADSVCLLVLLDRIRERLPVQLFSFHLNHGLRGEQADRDEAFVADLCARLGVPCAAAREPVRDYAASRKISEEEAGRELRYRHLEAEARRLGGAKIAVAHHLDDDAETVLLNLFRGAGLRGMGGIRPVRGNVIRPLLCLTREEIRQYLAAAGYAWREDSTNAEPFCVRNRIRNELLPWARDHVNGGAAGHICAFAGLAREADDYFSGQAGKILMECPAAPGGAASSPTAVLDAQPRILRAYLVRALIERAAGGGRDITERHIDAVLALTGPGGGRETALPWGLRAERGYGALTVLRADPAAGSDPGGRAGREGPLPESRLGVRARTRVFPYEKDSEIPKNPYTKWFDYDKIKGMPCIRACRGGDFFVLPGGGRKTLRRFMIDEKIPQRRRALLPVFADEEQVIWVIGYRISEYYKISDSTKTIMEVRICKGEENV